MVADNPGEKIELKTFCAEIMNDHKMLGEEQSKYKELPVFADIEQHSVLDKFMQVKIEIGKIVRNELERMMDTPELNECIVRKE